MDREDLMGTVLSHLPRGVELRHITAHARLRCAPNRSWGETYLLLHKGELLLMTRASVFDRYDVIELDENHPPRLKTGPSQSDVFVQAKSGETHRLPVSSAELSKVEILLQKYTDLKAEGS